MTKTQYDWQPVERELINIRGHLPPSPKRDTDTKQGSQYNKIVPIQNGYQSIFLKGFILIAKK